MSPIPAAPRSPAALTCNTSTIRLYAADLRAASAQLDDLGGFCRGEALLPAWIGDDATAYHDGLPTEGRRSDALSLGLRHVSQRVEAHADRLDELQDARDALIEERTSIAASILGLHGRAALAVSPEGRAAVDEDAALVRQDFSSYLDRVSTWEAQVASEEQAMIRAFENHQDDDRVADRYEGRTDPADAALATLPHGGSPDDVSAWWNGLDEEQQLAILAASPGSIGNLNGIPAWARSEANETALLRDIAMLEQRKADGHDLSGDEEKWLRHATEARDALQQVRDSPDPRTGDTVEPQLYIYDPLDFGGDGRVAISVGNLDTADNVSVLVPGLSNSAANIDNGTERALNIYQAARYESSETTASMIWIGYDAPNGAHDSAGVAFESMARNGAEKLADDIDGLRAGRPDANGEAHMTVVGHSYGSTTTGTAATEHGLDVDSIVLVGSPGPGDDAEHAGDLGIGDDNVYVGQNSRDFVASLGDKGWINKGNVEGGLGRDPGEEGWGGTRFRAEDENRGGGLNLGDHSRYFNHDTESLSNIAKVVVGEGDEVRDAGRRTDPWYAGWQDPEWDRDPERVKTRG